MVFLWVDPWELLVQGLHTLKRKKCHLIRFGLLKKIKQHIGEEEI